MSSVMQFHQAHADKQGFPLRMFAAAFVISILTTAITGWQLWKEHNRFEEMSRNHIALTEGVGRVMLLDEVLTMSARLSAATGDFSYEKRYDQFDPQLTAAITNLRALLPQAEIEQFVRETDEANLALVKMERQAFALTHQGRRQEAMTLLTSDEYARFKKVYAGGIQKTISAKNSLLERDIQHLHLLSLVSTASSIAGVLVLLATWFFAARSTRHWVVERAESENVLREARDELEVLVKQRTADLQNANEELQHEISEHMRAKGALLESEDRYRGLFVASHDAIMILEPPSWAFTSGNPATIEMFGAKNEADFLSCSPWTLSPELQPDGRASDEKAWEMIDTAVREGSCFFEWVHKRIGGDEFIADVLLSRVKQGEKIFLHALVRDITKRKHLEEKIQQIADHDSLTGLPNRKLFSDRLGVALAQAQRNQKEVGIAILDLDNFKGVNDTLGHDVGDLLLKATAERLSAALRNGDTVARLGGDEFVLILPDSKVIEDMIHIAQRIVDSFRKPFLIGTHQVVVTTSIGIAVYPNDGIDEGVLLKNADIAMYQAKQAGRARYQLYKKACKYD
jgi:diguanylate cyclase (GGDEF)-like protein/PAS domain S-box-containing protein